MPGMSVAPLPSTTCAVSRGREAPPAGETAAMRLPSTNTSAANGAAPVPSKTSVLMKRIIQSPQTTAPRTGPLGLKVPMEAAATEFNLHLELGLECNAHLPQRV